MAALDDDRRFLCGFDATGIVGREEIANGEIQQLVPGTESFDRLSSWVSTKSGQREHLRVDSGQREHRQVDSRQREYLFVELGQHEHL